MRTTQRGFTLVEVLVASAVFVIFMVGMLNLLDTSTRVAQIESDLADTQENVRFAAYHIMRTARMLGGAAMPFAGDPTGTPRWVSGELVSNASGTIQIPGFGSATVLSGSDVLTLRGFFEISPFFTDPGTVLSGSSTVTIPEYNSLNQDLNNFESFSVTGLEGRGIVFMGEGKYCVGRIDAGAGFVGADLERKLVLDHMEGSSPWSDLNTTWSYPPTFKVYRVGVLDSYTYFVDPNNVLRRVRLSAGSIEAEPVAINIGGLQVLLGLDTDNDGQADTWEDDPTGAGDVAGDTVNSMRIAVLGRTPFEVPGWDEPDATFEIFDGTTDNKNKSAKWRRIVVEVNLRNYKF